MPLAYWTIKAASENQLIEEVYVSTDDNTIKKTVEDFGLEKVTVINRSDATSSDEATTESAMLEFAESREFDDIVLIQATSPLLKVDELIDAVDLYLNGNADTLISVVRQKRFVWEAEENGAFARPLNYNPLIRPRRQEFQGYLVENGAFYITSRTKLIETQCRISGKVSLYEMNEESYFEIDEPSDWIIAEKLMEERLKQSDNPTPDFKDINLLICDVDGVLTDAGMYYSSTGEELKKFNTRDGKGIEIIRRAGINVMLLTSEDINLVKKRADKLKVDYLFMGIKDKKSFLDVFFEKNQSFSFSKTAYIGDDVNDLECMQNVGISATPKDGHDSLKSIATIICNFRGGEGCVREFCDLILQGRA